MTEEQKDFLIKDLCARLPYGVKVVCETEKNIFEIEVITSNGCVCPKDKKCLYDIDVDEIKPYLFPLSSMTEEQRIELYKVLGLGYESHYHLLKEWEDFNYSIDNNDLFLPSSWISDLNKMYNWLDKNHFDYRGLIPMGLALDTTGLNIY